MLDQAESLLQSKAFEIVELGQKIASFPFNSVEAQILLQGARYKLDIEIYRLGEQFALITTPGMQEKLLLPTFIKTNYDFKHFISSLKIAFLAGKIGNRELRADGAALH